MTKTEAFQTAIDTLSFMDDWEDRYAYIIDLGRALPDFPDTLKTDDALVRGCTSRVWMVFDESEAGTIHILADSDAHIVRGLIAVLCAAYNGLTYEQACKLDIEAHFDEMGLGGHLSPNRRNGFFAMVERIKSKACLEARPE